MSERVMKSSCSCNFSNERYVKRNVIKQHTFPLHSARDNVANRAHSASATTQVTLFITVNFTPTHLQTFKKKYFHGYILAKRDNLKTTISFHPKVQAINKSLCMIKHALFRNGQFSKHFHNQTLQWRAHQLSPSSKLLWPSQVTETEHSFL